MLTLHPPGIGSAVFQRWALNPLSGHWTTDPAVDITFWQPLLQYLSMQMLHNLWIILPGLLVLSPLQPTPKKGKLECFATRGLWSYYTFVHSSRVIVWDGDQFNQQRCRFRLCWNLSVFKAKIADKLNATMTELPIWSCQHLLSCCRFTSVAFLYLFLFSFLWPDSSNWLTKQKTGGVHYVIAPQCYYSAVDEANVLYNISIQSCLMQLPCWDTYRN